MPFTLEEAIKGKSNNLQLIKFLAAIAVIMSHAFALTGNDEKDWMAVITLQQMDFGMLAVSIFFLTSGLLIAKSMERTQTFRAFFKIRCIRIFPLLFLVVISTVIFGVILTELSVKEYFTDSTTWRYLLNSVLLIQYPLPGVFEHNIYGNVVNGSLWTLPMEFLCYIACFIIFKLGCMKKKRILFFMALYLGMALAANGVLFSLGQTVLIAGLQPCWLFLLGMFFYTYREKIVLNVKIFIVHFMCMAVFIYCHLYILAIWFCLPYVILYLSFMQMQCNAVLAKTGNYSYAIYLCAYPIQQTLVAYTEGGCLSNMIISTILAVGVGMLFYHLEEQPVTNWLMHKKEPDKKALLEILVKKQVR